MEPITFDDEALLAALKTFEGHEIWHAIQIRAMEMELRERRADDS